MMKKRLEYTMLAGILINALTMFLPLVNVTLVSDFKRYTEGYSIGYIFRLLIPCVFNGGAGALSNPSVALMAVMLMYVVCWIAGVFTTILVIKSMRSDRVNIFRTVAVSVFEALSALFMLVFSAQMKSFAVSIAVEPFKGHVKSSSVIVGTVAALIVLLLAFVNVFMLIGIIRKGGQYDEIDEQEHEPERRPSEQRRPARTIGYDRYEERHGDPRRSAPRRPDTAPHNYDRYGPAAPAPRTQSGDRTQSQSQRAYGNTGVIDRYNLPRQTTQPINRPVGRPQQPTSQRPSAPADRRPQSQSSARPIICPSCGARCRSGSRFCNICGERFDSRPASRTTCSGCGAKISENDVFCPTCGAIIK
jgi:hypothetical protein